MASDEALEASASQKEALVEATTSRSAEVSDNYKSRSCNSEETESASDDLERVKVAAPATTAGITFDFGAMENNTRYFLKGYCWPSGVESVPMRRVNEVVVFEDFFCCRASHASPALTEIIHKFWVQMHQLTPNVIVQIGKFIWAVNSCGGRPTTDVFV
jgi:hypothetical protein